ncbi:hypothetical protein COO60DRAFT_271856 [Scenedesmus sp. NREL 46B-D3]|nr:hypothetical protein COO60DRAFT_271856 [Scenedesmus sp. NREL 46B-D3]
MVSARVPGIAELMDDLVEGMQVRIRVRLRHPLSTTRQGCEAAASLLQAVPPAAALPGLGRARNDAHQQLLHNLQQLQQESAAALAALGVCVEAAEAGEAAADAVLTAVSASVTERLTSNQLSAALVSSASSHHTRRDSSSNGGSCGTAASNSDNSERCDMTELLPLLYGLGARLVSCGQALAELCPVPLCCNNPGCVELRGARLRAIAARPARRCTGPHTRSFARASALGRRAELLQHEAVKCHMHGAQLLFKAVQTCTHPGDWLEISKAYLCGVYRQVHTKHACCIPLWNLV